MPNALAVSVVADRLAEVAANLDTSVHDVLKLYPSVANYHENVQEAFAPYLRMTLHQFMCLWSRTDTSQMLIDDILSFCEKKIQKVYCPCKGRVLYRKNHKCPYFRNLT